MGNDEPEKLTYGRAWVMVGLFGLAAALGVAATVVTLVDNPPRWVDMLVVAYLAVFLAVGMKAKRLLPRRR